MGGAACDRIRHVAVLNAEASRKRDLLPRENRLRRLLSEQAFQSCNILATCARLTCARHDDAEVAPSRNIAEAMHAERIARRDHESWPTVSCKQTRLALDHRGLVERFQRRGTRHD